MDLQSQSLTDVWKAITDFYQANGPEYLNRFFYMILILVLGYYLVRFSASAIEKGIIKTKVDKSVRTFTVNVYKTLGYLFVIIACLSQLGIDTTALAAALAAIGLAIGLSLQGTLSNLAAGLVIVLFKFFKAGHYVEIAGVGGFVEEVSIFTTQLRTPDNKGVILPNNKIISEKIINYSKNKTRRMDIVIGVSYASDLKMVRSVIQKVLNEEKRLLKEPKADIVVGELADSSVNFFVRPWVNSGEFLSVKFSLLEKLKTEFDKNKIEIPFPQRDVHLYNEKK